MTMTLDEHAGAALREKLNASASKRVQFDNDRRSEAQEDASARQVQGRNRAKEVAQAAASVQLQLAEIGEARSVDGIARAAARASENQARSQEVQESLETLGKTRAQMGEWRAQKRAAEREALAEETHTLIANHAEARSEMREALNAFASAMHGNAPAVSVRAPRTSAVRAARPAVTAKPARQGALSTGITQLSPVEKRRETIVLKTINNVQGLSLSELQGGLRLPDGDLETILKRLVAQGKIALRDGGYFTAKGQS